MLGVWFLFVVGGRGFVKSVGECLVVVVVVGLEVGGLLGGSKETWTCAPDVE